MNFSPPDQGGRFLFERLEAREDRAEYQLTVTGDGEMWRGRAAIALPDGDCNVRWESTPPPAWMNETAASFLKTQLASWRRAERQDAPPESLWPRRIHRWRAPRKQSS